MEGSTAMPIARSAAVQMWYDERGHGDPSVLLHPGGAGVDSRALTPTLEALSELFHVYAPEQRGHGHTPDVEGPITYELMAQDTITFIETVIGQPVYLLGCSDGAIVALMVALRRPDLVRRLVLATGAFHRDGSAEGVLDGGPHASRYDRLTRLWRALAGGPALAQDRDGGLRRHERTSPSRGLGGPGGR